MVLQKKNDKCNSMFLFDGLFKGVIYFKGLIKEYKVWIHVVGMR